MQYYDAESSVPQHSWHISQSSLMSYLCTVTCLVSWLRLTVYTLYTVPTAVFWNCCISDMSAFTFCVSRRRRKMYCGHVRLSVCVCLSVAVRPHYCTDPDVTWRHGSGCPLVVHYWADLQSVHGLRCYGNITRTLVTSLRPSHDMTT